MNTPMPAHAGDSAALELFRYQDHEIRTLIRDGEPWFVAADVCAILGYTHTPSAIRRLDADEYAQAEFPQVTPNVRLAHTGPPPRPVTIVNEPGLYSLILGSEKPEAKAFKRWVSHEVLPAIRRTGRYEVALPADPIELLRGMLDQIAAAQQAGQLALVAAEESRDEARLANARLDAIEDQRGWVSGLGYAHLHGLRADVQHIAKVGRLAGTIGRRQGLTPAKIPSQMFGEVNGWPPDVWAEAFARLGDREVQS